MKFKEIKLDSELENYRKAIHKHIDVLFPLDYLKQGRVFGYFDRNGNICGGFALILNGPFRVIESIPNFKGFDRDPHLKKTAEITGVWLSKTDRSRFSSLRFWTKLLYKVVTSKKKYFVYAYSTKKSNLEKIYSRTKPVILFRGHTKLLPGMDAPEHESVEVMIKSRLFTQTLKNSDFFFKRIFVKYNLYKKNILKKDSYEISSLPLIHNFNTSGELCQRESKTNY